LQAESFVEAFSDKIISIHISDNDLYLDRHLPIGEGRIDFRRVLNLLKDIGFGGTVNIELRTNEDRLLSKQRLEPILTELDIDH
jgi:sugar phosphate isomerase/epimerase